MNAQNPPRIDRAATGSRRSAPRLRLLRDERFLNLGVVLTLLATGAIHAAQIASHLQESRAAGLFFGVVATFQVMFAAVLLLGRSRASRIAVLVLTVSTMAVWLTSRTAGIPLGPHAGSAEAIQAADAVATGLETVTAALLAVLLSSARWRLLTVSSARGRYRVREVAAGLSMALVIAATTTVGLRPVHLHAHDETRKDVSTTSGNHKLLDLLEHHHTHEIKRGSR